MGITQIAAVLSLGLAMYAAVHYTEAHPAPSLDINSVFLGLCPRYLVLLSDPEQPECTEDFIDGIQNDLKDEPSATDVIVYLKLAEGGELGLRSDNPNEQDSDVFDSACEILEQLCTPMIRVPAGARFRRQSSNSTSNSASGSMSGSGSGEST